MKLSVTLFLVLLVHIALSQPLFYGVTDYKGGTIFKYDAAANNLSTVYKHQLHETFPSGSLSLGKDGLFYGTTLTGGPEGSGAIFSYHAELKEYKLLYTFTSENGNQPTGTFAWGADGKMYGLATYGGAYNNGVLFSFVPQTGAFEKLYDFDAEMGANPIGGLYVDANGKLYGTTQLGGVYGQGVLFSYDPAQRLFKKHHDFNPAKGAYPASGLTKGKDGKLYGATTFGGPEDWFAGAIYRFDPVKGTVSNLYWFNWASDQGHGPVSQFTLMPDGKLYGVTDGGGNNFAGVIFSFDPATKAYSKLYDFSETSGITPAGHLVAGADGMLYGTTKEGNTNGYGGVFAFDPAKKNFRNLHALQYADGINVSGTVCIGKDGLLYALAPFGGEPEYGTLFSINPKTATYTKLKEWDEAPDGAYPVAAMAMHKNGLYYGSTVGGGHFGKGTIYSFDPASGLYKVVYRFEAGAGQYMNSSFIAAKDGRMYGLMNNGGTGGAGQIFSFDPASGKVQALYNFNNTEGGFPDGGLLEGNDGKLYGTASSGGQMGNGAVFSFDAATGTYGNKLVFDGNAGRVPLDGLTKTPDGRLVGITQMGGENDMGVLFSFDPQSGAYAGLLQFRGSNGEYPLRGVTVGKDGKLYGTTPTGGTAGEGVLYSYDLKSGKQAILHHFEEADGANPQGRLYLAIDGRLYGFTRRGGQNDLGVVFSFNPATGKYSKLKDFDGTGSGQPSSSGLSDYCTGAQTFYRDRDGDGYGNAAEILKACMAPAGYAASGTDCDDNNKAVNPGAAEICGNGIDDNCNGKVDEGCSEKIMLTVKSLTVTEADGEALVEVSLSVPVANKVKVHYYTIQGTALAGWDFSNSAGLLTLEPGSTKGTIRIKILPDKLKERDEQFNLFLWKPRDILLKNNKATITIKDSNPVKGSVIAASEKVYALPGESGLQVQAAPNPARHQFTLMALAPDNHLITAVVTDAAGKTVEVVRALRPNQAFVLGARYAPGFYLVRITQENKTALVKLIKQP